MFYHGTEKQRALSMLSNGVDLGHPNKSDPGDFGLGFYLTENLSRAKAYGQTIIKVEVDLSQFAYIDNPYLKTHDTPESRLFYQMAFIGDKMVTVGHIHPACRLAICRAIREEFMVNKYKGICTKYSGGETVVFDLSSIKSMAIREEFR
jgi:hypothetical protein